MPRTLNIFTMSTTYIANIVAVLAFILPHFGITIVDPGTFGAVLANTIGVLAAGWVFIGRWRAGGINILGLRKG